MDTSFPARVWALEDEGSEAAFRAGPWTNGPFRSRALMRGLHSFCSTVVSRLVLLNLLVSKSSEPLPGTHSALPPLIPPTSINSGQDFLLYPSRRPHFSFEAITPGQLVSFHLCYSQGNDCHLQGQWSRSPRPAPCLYRQGCSRLIERKPGRVPCCRALSICHICKASRRSGPGVGQAAGWVVITEPALCENECRCERPRHWCL